MSSTQPLRTHIMVNGVNIADQYVHMVRPSLANLTTAALDELTQTTGPLAKGRLPAGYHLRTYQPGDDAIWMELMYAAEPFFVVKQELFEEQFGAQRDSLAGRMFFVDSEDGETVGTASAWWHSNWRESGDWGMVHWVAVHPNHQRRGLAKPLVARVLHRMAQDHQRAFLGTSTGRVYAIKTYLDYGFAPDPNELQRPEILAAWQQLAQALPHPVLVDSLH
ncbi:MAG: GNAT family N-acetyltransferase [Caldilineaceae bacterium]